MDLTNDELKRYHRQMLMEVWGAKTQVRLKEATVFIAGAGGLGSPTAIYLATAGVGNLRICDFDSLDLTNLNRQILHDESRVGLNKAVSAEMTLAKTNPHIKITALTEKITRDNVDRLVDDAAIIADCLDNFETRYILNECAIRKKIPLVYGSIWGLDGRLSFIQVPETPCFQCIFSEAPPKEVFPVLGTTPAVIGSLQALEVLKFLTGIGSVLKNRLLVWQGASADFRTYKIRKNPDCPACGHLTESNF